MFLRSRFVVVALFVVAALVVATSRPTIVRAQAFAVADRIEVRDGGSWRRGVVSDDNGSSSTLKVRLDPQGSVTIVPRASVRPAPRPATINVGDRLEWNGGSYTSFEYVAATVRTIGTGNMDGYVMMVLDKYPNSPSYTKRENLWLLPEAGPHATVAENNAPLPGLYRCYAYGRAGAAPMFLASILLLNSSVYTAFGKRGRYAFDGASNTITWLDGWAKDNAFGGTVETNATFRLRGNTLCSHS